MQCRWIRFFAGLKCICIVAKHEVRAAHRKAAFGCFYLDGYIIFSTNGLVIFIQSALKIKGICGYAADIKNYAKANYFQSRCQSLLSFAIYG